MSVRLIETTPSAYGYPLLIKNLLKTPRVYSPDREIIFQDKSRYDYRTLFRRISRLARVLDRADVKQGQTVAVMEYDSHRYLESFFAIPMMGSVIHTVNIRRSPESLVHTLNHAGSAVIIANKDFLAVLDSIRDRLTHLKKIILIDGDADTVKTSLEVVGEYEALLADSPADFRFEDFSEDAVAATFYAVGSGGAPKGVCFSHRQLVMHTYSILACLCAYRFQPMVDSGDVYMPLTPMFHVNAWGLVHLFTHLGAKQVYPGRSDPETILDLIQAEGVTFSHCDPSLIHTLINCPRIREVDLSGWKVIVGGAPLSPDLCRSALELGINICSVYGMAETGPMLTAAALKPHMADWSLDRQADVRTRTGLPAPLVHLEVVDVMGDPLPHDGKSIGEVVVRAPWLTQGYVGDPEESEKLWRGGWLHTGDIGFIDEEEYLRLTDRTEDAIKTGGEWIPSMELEDIICEHEAVGEAAVTRVPDEKYGEKPLALVVLKPGFEGKVDEETIRRFCQEYVRKGALPKHGVPERIAIVDAIPRTSVGKVSRRQLRQQNKPFDLNREPGSPD